MPIGLDGPKIIGRLHAEFLRGKEVFSFEYHEDWLSMGYAQVIDPDLQYYSGLHFLNEPKSNFGAFLDSSPDRWGRVLMARREAALARQEKREEVKLSETDFLLGVYDGHRMGGLRFKLTEDGPFLDDNESMSTPPWTSLRELEHISLRLENEDVSDHPNYMEWLNVLIAPGSSLGGARPKASILDQKGQLWISKFPSKNDYCDVGAWEMVAYDLAINAGINMAESKIEKFSDNGHTFLTKRFDRNAAGDRIHFASAMTMLGKIDEQEGSSYLEIVDFLSSYGSEVDQDLEQLWRRIVFSICVSNSDDHLRNHGFILQAEGWKLSPAYDINPSENARGLNLNISETDNALSLELAMEVAKYFRLNHKKSRDIMDEVMSSVKQWRSVARGYGISRTECDLKSTAFGVIE